MQEGIQSLEERKWMKYVIASALIHAVVLSVPFSIMVPRIVEPIEVFMLEGTSMTAPSGGNEKQQKTKDKPRVKMHMPTVREDVRIRPQETARPVEQKVEPVQAVTENIAGKELVALHETASTAKNEVGAASGGGQEKTVSASSNSEKAATGGYGQGSDTGAADAKFGSPDGPRFLHREIPEYPFLARKRKKEGKVVLAVVIDAMGRLIKTEVVEASDRIFIETSLEALKKSTFLPAKRNGWAVASRALLPIRFSLVD